MMILDKGLIYRLQCPSEEAARTLKLGDHMSSHPRPLFDGSLAALTLLNGPHKEGFTLAPGELSRRLGSGTAMAMSILFAPEPEPTANTVDLDEEQTTGPLALDFEFEFFGVHYTSFDLSANGFITLGTGSSPYCSKSAQRIHFIPLNEDLSNFIALGCIDVVRPGRRRIAYEVRGTEGRRRLVVSFTPIPGTPEVGLPAMAAQVILHERTGMIDVHTTSRYTGGSSSKEAAIRLTTSPACVPVVPLDTHPGRGILEGR
jgi:hypothetical protein